MLDSIYDSDIAKQLEGILRTAVQNSLMGQQHIATGKGINSIEAKVLPSGSNIIIQIIGEDYLLYQETGRKPGKFPNVDALLRWVMQKGMARDMKEGKKVAFVIGRNMKRIGMHSKNGRIDESKRGFISKTIENRETLIDQKMFQMFEKKFNQIVQEAVKSISGNYKVSL